MIFIGILKQNFNTYLKPYLQIFLYLIKFAAMKEGYVIRDQTLPHFLTATIVDWVEVFSRKENYNFIIDCLEFCKKEKMNTHISMQSVS